MLVSNKQSALCLKQEEEQKEEPQAKKWFVP